MTLDSNSDVASMILPFLRELQNNSTTPTNYYSGSSSGDPSVYNFIAFLAWYIFLVLCCVVPTACAYRRRQRIASQRNRQEYLERMAAQGPLSAGSQANREIVETDEARKERVQNLVEHLKGTTMTVSLKDLIDIELGTKLYNNKHGIAGGPTDPATADHDVDLEKDVETDLVYLQLDAGAINGARKVPAACAICLCPYEEGDSVTHSSQIACQHAFHTECITTWLTKKQDQMCPCCRQLFCERNSTGTTCPALLADEEAASRTVTSEGMTFTYSQ